ncbi:hypothetical protein Rcae01_02520 [Novipirellula caenicola]|uniref:Uncharacterized protein n=1 Tax=Novipirellula caenicola TaxID=1536901 RepID=A0ABP9VQX0_9BACT
MPTTSDVVLTSESNVSGNLDANDFLNEVAMPS